MYKMNHLAPSRIQTYKARFMPSRSSKSKTCGLDRLLSYQGTHYVLSCGAHYMDTGEIYPYLEAQYLQD